MNVIEETPPPPLVDESAVADARAGRWRMALPLSLIALACLSAGGMAYGTHPDLGGYAFGLELILYARRLQWLLAAGAVGVSLALVALVMAGRNRAWWLIGLAPVMALFVHRFATDPLNALSSIESPIFTMARDATFLKPDEYVVGLEFQGIAHAFPYAVLFEHPVVFHADHDKRLLLMWSRYANLAVATETTREIRPRDVEILSMPANALLLYNKRLGQFINGLTGMTVDGGKPAGFSRTLPTFRMTWGEWRGLHPDSRVLLPPTGVYTASRAHPVGPRYRMPADGEVPAHVSVSLIATSPPIAVVTDDVTEAPLNLMAGRTPVLVFRDPETKHIRAFERRIEDDLTPRFRPKPPGDPREVFLIDNDTGSGWSLAGVAVEGTGDMKGKRLAPLRVDEHLYWDVMKFWHPELELIRASAE